MPRFFKALFCAVLAVVAMGTAASVASATGTRVNISSGSTATATATNLTLTGSAVGTVIGNVTLNITGIPTSQDCANADGAGLVQIGTIASGGVQILTPNTVTAALLFGTSWTINGTCVDGEIVLDVNGLPQLSILNVQFQIRVNAITQPLYAGSVTGSLSADGSSLTITSSSLRATPGGSAGALRGSFAISPRIAYVIS
jgi:hypothetical protein